MVIKILSFGFRNQLFKQAMQVRRRVFVEEMGIDPDLDFDSFDPEAAHFLLLVEDHPVGAARWIETRDGIRIERLSIISTHRHQGLGSLLLRFIIKDVLPSKKTIYLFAPEHLQEFFMWNGFKPQDETQEIFGQQRRKMTYIRKKEERQGMIKKLFKRK